jgi:hypothetical protein
MKTIRKKLERFWINLNAWFKKWEILILIVFLLSVLLVILISIKSWSWLTLPAFYFIVFCIYFYIFAIRCRSNNYDDYYTVELSTDEFYQRSNYYIVQKGIAGTNYSLGKYLHARVANVEHVENNTTKCLVLVWA